MKHEGKALPLGFHIHGHPYVAFPENFPTKESLLKYDVERKIKSAQFHYCRHKNVGQMIENLR